MVPAPPRPPRGERIDAQPVPAETIPTVEVSALIGTGREAVIVHKGERYRLRLTSNDKLILTK